MSKAKTIGLYEDEGGHLYLSDGESVFLVEQPQDRSFLHDAAEIYDSGRRGRYLRRVSNVPPKARPTAWFDGRSVTIERTPGGDALAGKDGIDYLAMTEVHAREVDEIVGRANGRGGAAANGASVD